jgi:CheY-like chemotaxis protein
VVAEAADGQEALDAFDALDPPPTPTVILLDNRMPVLSGLEAAREILARHPEQRIVLFTAYSGDEVQREAKAVGITAVVAKTHAGRLPQILRRLIEDSP